MPALSCHATPYAGSWYPGDPARLEALLEDLRVKSERRTGANLLADALAFVVPHAGIAYSGRVASAVYRHVARQQPRRVIILGFSHRGGPPGVWVPDIAAYRTPLGETPVDRESARELVEAGVAHEVGEDRVCDHSVEIQLPFLQRAAPDAVVLPLYVASLRPDERETVASALADLLTPGTVALASSDFTHYGDAFGYRPFPVDKRTPGRLRALDEEFIDAAASLDAGLLVSTLRSASATVCGREPVALLLSTLAALPSGDDVFQVTLDYETSGDISGDYAHCVSYAALGYFPWSSFALGPEDQQLLIDSARETLLHYQSHGVSRPIPPRRRTPGVERQTGAFVSLHKGGDLRGCVGRCAATAPLAEVIPEMTLAAGLQDTRFAPLRPDETDIDIEISVLSPMKPLPDRSRFRVGIDGGYLKVDGHAGLLLPQVAENRDWTRDQFLSALARKTGVPGSAYDEPGARLYVFRAQIIR